MKATGRTAFSLVEVLVVMSIIALLVAVLLPMIFHARTQAKKQRTQADFQTISIALEAYKQDFGDIPRVPEFYVPNPNTPDTAFASPNVGAATLCKALLGPYGDGLTSTATDDPNDPPPYNSSILYKTGQCVSQGTAYYVAIVDQGSAIAPPAPGFWAHFNPRDGYDGPGFRVRQQGKSYPAYIQPEKIGVSGCVFTDADGHPILYFATSTSATNVTEKSLPGAVPSYVGLNSTAPPARFFINAGENFEPFRHPADDDLTVLARMRLMLGDFNNDNFCQPVDNETAVHLPYLLWSPGPDGIFGPASFTPAASPTPADVNANRAQASKCDDITNIP